MKHSEINVGDTVWVVDTDFVYPMYSTWIYKHAPIYAIYYAFGHKPSKDDCFTVIAKAPHERASEGMLYLIKDKDIGSCYIISRQGLKTESEV